MSAADIKQWYGIDLAEELLLGGVVGITEIVDCVKPHHSRWYVRGQHAFVLANSRPLPFVKWKGSLSITDAPKPLLARFSHLKD